MTPDGTQQKPRKRGAKSPAKGTSDLDLLRQILVGTNHLEVREVRDRVIDPERRAKDVGEVLARAIVIRSKEDGQLAAAMRPTIEATLSDSVRRNPQAIVDVIFPIIGPAIRKAISQSMASMVGSINRTVESAFTFRGLKWRIQAWRTGKSYGEIALSHNLVYRVEQMFLIHRKSGLLIQQLTNTGEDAEEPEVVSAMLTAIRDFVHDSFDVEEGSGLDTFRVGDLNLLIEQGSGAILAAVVRGIPPPQLRPKLVEAVETIHADYQVPLAGFEGDPSEFAGVEAVLEECLLEQRKEKKERTVSSFLFWTLVFGGIIALISWWVVATTRAAERRDSWNAYLEALRDEPGIVVTWASDSDGALHARGLRDPMAREPITLLEGIELPENEIALTFDPYHASHEPFVLERITKALRPLPTITLTLEDGTLRVAGRAPHRWIEAARRTAPIAVGVETLDLSAVVGDGRLDAIIDLRKAVEAAVWMAPAEADFDAKAAELLGSMKALTSGSEDAGLLARLRVVYAGDGTDTLARRLFDYLKRRGQPVTGAFPASEDAAAEPASIRVVCELRPVPAGGDSDK
ncbi:MAG: hypothetical protein QNJ98_03380 [Planctomycetota bacterium]|nr:hypothetical protein [Planctomycetota bacterium]